MIETLNIDGLAFEVRRSVRRKTLGLTVDRGGDLVLHSPCYIERDELIDWTRTKLLWVYRKLAVKERLKARGHTPEYVTGESFSYLGRHYRLIIVTRQEQILRFDGYNYYLLRDARTSAYEHFRNWYIQTGGDWVKKRISGLAPKVGALPDRIAIRDLGFRWGSCGKNRVMNLNWIILQFPVRLVDYVICHELAHLIEPHHGPTFWALLGRSLPDWEKRKDELKIQASVIYWCHSGMRD